MNFRKGKTIKNLKPTLAAIAVTGTLTSALLPATIGQAKSAKKMMMK